MIIERDGTYILYYSVSTLGSQDSVIAYATSTTMEDGTSEDHGSTGVESTSGNSYNAIDPTMVLVDGTYHLSFGSYWGDIHLVTFNSDATAANGDATQIIYEPDGNHEVEASFPFKYGDYFYMFWSQGQANDYDIVRPAEGEEYRIRACRSSDIGGPYTDEDGDSCLEGGGNDVLASHDDVYGPGGQGVYNDAEYGPILYYRFVNTSIGYALRDYQWGWNVIDWVDGWPTI
ncbi:hypothetical protein KVR01_003021 [Diaporthe batatas]|uniref:uncharacterized protein n=1 Tax=Diaporthe batatas TaxID=748121 RepID=UPI001D0415B1|nr:uncharacterized protein KVR01_003021 [Diaporthe batatas]KAG8167332.1 hypothetical protein KVR01_003021 [Diaporthe batatas]